MFKFRPTLNNFKVCYASRVFRRSFLEKISPTRLSIHSAKFATRSPNRRLRFIPELAQRILTRRSHNMAARGHNARLSSVGRRVLES
ncbi:hypothetical protein BDR07DRAFT_1418432, partial [Suillus spraguei]